MIHRYPPIAALPSAAAFLFAVAVLASGCGASVSSARPPAGSGASAAPPAAGSDAIETLPPVTSGPLLEGQTDTDTDVGRIWDTLPRSFPMYPGAKRSDEAQDGPSSGVYVVEGDPQAIATWFRDQLQTAAFGTASSSGPLEDGSFEVDSVGPDPGCHLRVVIAPLGSLTGLTTYYGAGCPHA